MGKVHASLFSGFGAADLAATWVGWDNAFWCEIDDFPRTVLSYWFPKSKGYGNIKETDFTPWRGKIDILTGGFPCQPFSVAGQRKGQEDDRYLWPEMLRAIREIRPTWIIGENVGGIISMVQPGSEITVESQASLFEEADKETILEQEYVVETVCRDLEQEGYKVHPIVIPACAVGAPHRRDRIFFIAYRSDAGAESVQRKRKDRVYQSEITSDTNSHDAGRSGHEEVECQTGKSQTAERKWEWVRCNAKRIGKEGTFTYSQCTGSGQIQQEIQSQQPDGNGVNGISHERNVTDTNGQMLQKRLKTRRWQNAEEIRTRLDNGTKRFGGLRYAPYAKDQRFQERYISPIREESGFNSRLPYETRRNWRNFPTQSPICRGNDGLPFDVVRLTISLTAWCTGSIKGYGNAIVSQVMYEIFKAIETIQD
jgi:DNA (cytosine-5)-methyltransferase 1